MIFEETVLPGAYLIRLTPHSDARGQFARAWCRDEFTKHGLADDFVQGNVSINPKQGTMRGLHYQEPPHGEVKIVRCVRGAIYDVIVDVRPDSPTFGKWQGFELVPTGMQALYVPAGFAHGFVTMVDDTEVNYLVSEFYTPHAGRGLRYDDPSLGISWPVPVTCISVQDRTWPLMLASASTSAPIGTPLPDVGEARRHAAH